MAAYTWHVKCRFWKDGLNHIVLALAEHEDPHVRNLLADQLPHIADTLNHQVKCFLEP